MNTYFSIQCNIYLNFNFKMSTMDGNIGVTILGQTCYFSAHRLTAIIPVIDHIRAGSIWVANAPEIWHRWYFLYSLFFILFIEAGTVLQQYQHWRIHCECFLAQGLLNFLTARWVACINSVSRTLWFCKNLMELHERCSLKHNHYNFASRSEALGLLFFQPKGSHSLKKFEIYFRQLNTDEFAKRNFNVSYVLNNSTRKEWVHLG